MQFGADEKKLEYIHLTLALKNCKINELQDTIELMLKSFKKFVNRDIFKQKGKGAKGTIKGWFRNLEITFNQEDKTFHPHFHIILAVEKSYFFKETNPDKYLTQEVALQMWKECLGVDYLPTTDLRKVYYLDENGNKIINFDDDDGEGLKKAVEEASKYITKAMELLSIDDEKLQKKVIKSMLQALSYRRLFAYGGILKNIRAELKLQDEEKSNLINLGDDEIDTTGMEYFVEVYKWCQENGGQYKKFVELSEVEYKKLEKSMQDERKNENYSNEDINRELSSQNYQLIECDSYKEKINQEIKERYKVNKSIRKDAVLCVETVFTSDKEFFDKLTPEQERLYFEKSVEFLKEQFGEKNIIFATVHKDETTPHLHAGFIPMTDDGRLSYKNFVNSKYDLIKLQDKYFEKMVEFFPELERGQNSKETKARHLANQEYKIQQKEKD